MRRSKGDAMPQPDRSSSPSDEELRESRLRDPDVQERVKRIQKEFSNKEDPAGGSVSARELPDFLRDHG